MWVIESIIKHFWIDASAIGPYAIISSCSPRNLISSKSIEMQRQCLLQLLQQMVFFIYVIYVFDNCANCGVLCTWCDATIEIGTHEKQPTTEKRSKCKVFGTERRQNAFCDECELEYVRASPHLNVYRLAIGDWWANVNTICPVFILFSWRKKKTVVDAFYYGFITSNALRLLIELWLNRANWVRNST